MFGSKRSTGDDSLMSSARPCGRPSTMSIKTTSARPRWTILIAAVCPTNPLPTTVTRMDAATTPSAVELLDHGVRDIGGADGRRIVSRRLHVVRERLPRGDHGGDRGLEAVGGLLLLQVTEHQHAR